MRVVYFDCPSGAAGDMIMAALVDAGAPLEALRAELRKLPAPARAFWPGTAGSAERSRAN